MAGELKSAGRMREFHEIGSRAPLFYTFPSQIEKLDEFFNKNKMTTSAVLRHLQVYSWIIPNYFAVSKMCTLTQIPVTLTISGEITNGVARILLTEHSHNPLRTQIEPDNMNPEPHENDFPELMRIDS